ncbi:hypothetical protein A1O1_03388 [Capronia coronata CBS 617.96]|uniref:N-acetyltransferase domain-containing protein n=1 Tax=Capronia coronata CBS 617.96 TaxID=1182541 RepID=W9Z6Z1_9EURO|nr:uncharacterized protein A1O1_03388 [Capronia coronata CBS 617.96]EXJ90289.1 hypothetical protein A1O1_03388 [Capronia coronata CBS 617.96]
MKKTTRPVLPVPAPPLRTSRLLLRPFQPSDLADFHVLRTQIEVMMWTSTGKEDANQEVTQAWMNRFLPPNEATTFNFAVEELAVPGVVIGALGCHTSEPPEVGFFFRKEYWGKGYATETFQRWLQAWWELPRKEVLIDSEGEDLTAQGLDGDIDMVSEVLRADRDARNVASARLLEKFGFRPVGEKTEEINGAVVKVIKAQLQRPN